MRRSRLTKCSASVRVGGGSVGLLLQCCSLDPEAMSRLENKF